MNPSTLPACLSGVRGFGQAKITLAIVLIAALPSARSALASSNATVDCHDKPNKTAYDGSGSLHQPFSIHPTRTIELRRAFLSEKLAKGPPAPTRIALLGELSMIEGELRARERRETLYQAKTAWGPDLASKGMRDELSGDYSKYTALCEHVEKILNLQYFCSLVSLRDDLCPQGAKTILTEDLSNRFSTRPNIWQAGRDLEHRGGLEFFLRLNRVRDELIEKAASGSIALEVLTLWRSSVVF